MRLWGGEEPSMKESANFLGRNAGSICRVAGRVYWQMRSSRWRCPVCRGLGGRHAGRRSVRCCRWRFPVESLGGRRLSTRSGGS